MARRSIRDSLSLIAFFSAFLFFVCLATRPAYAQRDLGAQADVREQLQEQRTEQTLTHSCICTQAGSTGANATFCATLLGPCEQMTHGGEFDALSATQKTALGGYQCRLVETESQFAVQTSAGDTSHVCPTQPYDSLEAAANRIAPPEPPPTPAVSNFVSITPELGVPIPGLTFSPATLENGTIEVPFLAQYISAIQRYLTGLAVTAALIMIVYGGFLYLLGSSMGDVGRGKTIITDAIIGLLLALGAYTVLHIVNPNLVQIDPIRLRYVEPVDLEMEQALGELTPPDNGPIMCVAFSECPDNHLVTLRDVLLEADQSAPGVGATYVAKIFDCTGNELGARNNRSTCGRELSQQMNPQLKPLFLSLLQQWPSGAGKLKIGEIHRQTQTQFYGFPPLRAACGPLLAGFPAPRSACPRGGHGTGSAMDVWFVPANQRAENNCGEVIPGKPFPVFMKDAGWYHLCHEDWHFEPASLNPSARTTNVWNNVPCIGGADDADSYMRLCPAPRTSTPPTSTP